MRQGSDAACKADHPCENTQKSDHDPPTFTRHILEMTSGLLARIPFSGACQPAVVKQVG
jgi:hypothetical protein